MGGDLSGQEGWLSGFENECEDAGFADDCLSVSIVVSRIEPDGTLTDIPNPGSDYADPDGSDPVYSDCSISAITPEPPAEVDVGTEVTIDVHCTPVAETPAEQEGGSGQGDETGP